jgi:cystathionine beta-lyase/cystathionine gamma-synthase
MAAISTVILGLCQSGDRVVCVRHVYPDSYRLMRLFLAHVMPYPRRLRLAMVEYG